MKRIGAIAIVLALALAGVSPSKEPTPCGQAEPLSIRIVPTSHRERTGRAIQLYGPGRHFHVVVTNTSRLPVRLWRDWCSWGYFNLSFAATDQAGRSFVVSKKPRGWDKNYPDWDIVPPGDHMVLEVSFDASTWENDPMPEAGKSRTIKMKAIYEVLQDEESMKHGVWKGRISSPEETYTLYR